MQGSWKEHIEKMSIQREQELAEEARLREIKYQEKQAWLKAEAERLKAEPQPEGENDFGPTKPVTLVKAGDHFLLAMISEKTGYPIAFVVRDAGLQNNVSIPIEAGNFFQALDDAMKGMRSRIFSGKPM